MIVIIHTRRATSTRYGWIASYQVCLWIASYQVCLDCVRSEANISCSVVAFSSMRALSAGKSQKIASAAAAVLSKFNAHMRPCSASTRRALPALQMLVQQQQADARAATSPRTNQMTEITTNVYSSYPLTRPTDRPNDPGNDQYESISLAG